jgi:hypothetical protein
VTMAQPAVFIADHLRGLNVPGLRQRELLGWTMPCD